MARDGSTLFRDILEWVVVFAIALAVFWVVRLLVVEPFTVPTGSMEPTR